MTANCSRRLCLQAAQRVFLSLLVLSNVFLTTCSAAALSEKAIALQEGSQVQAYTSLGAEAAKRYAADVVDAAVTDAVRLRASIRVFNQLLDQGIIRNCARKSQLQSAYDATRNSEKISIEFSPYSCEISNPEKFYYLLVSDRSLMPSTAKDKSGTWWAYIKTDAFEPWERYFWQTYFQQAGYDALFAPELRMLILTHFAEADSAIAFQSQFKSAPVNVSFIVFKDAKTSTAPPAAKQPNAEDEFVRDVSIPFVNEPSKTK